ncbi:hypothetical protein [Egicoccus sp. AB-alg2]|uniref:hypothetical protein n=1 Tax=Egicoccus sp. AB-alg2 TaxID=3242693 RepID=UPI00359D91A1
MTGPRTPSSPPRSPGGAPSIRRRRRTLELGSAWAATVLVAFATGLLVDGPSRAPTSAPDAPDVSASSAPAAPRAPSRPFDEATDEETAADRPAPPAGIVSTDLRPRRARLADAGSDRAARQVEVAFGDFVAAVLDPGAFVAQGHRAEETVRAVDARLVRDTDDRVLVTFPAGADLPHRVRLVVEEGAVRDEYGLPNVVAAVRLDGGDGFGRVAGPELLDVAAQPTLDHVVFRFDEPVRQPVASRFLAVASDGTAARGERIVSRGSTQVTVAFPGQVAMARRFVAEEGAVRGGTSGRPAPLGVSGGDTAAPDLVAVDRGPGGVQFDFRYDEAVVAGPADGFVAYRADGRGVRGRSVLRPTPEVVRVAFPADAMGDEVTLLGAGAGAVRGLAGGVAGTAGTAATVLDLPAGGVTAGPDPRSWDADPRTGQFTVRFDGNLATTPSPDPAGFVLVTDGGRRVPAHRLVEVAGDTVRLDADPAAVRAATALVVADGAVHDGVGDKSPVDTLTTRRHDGR